jgi:hypothetical protein
MQTARPGPAGADPPVSERSVGPVHAGEFVPADAPEMTVNEDIARYRDERILMEVTGFDDEGWPECGYLIPHSPRRSDISRALAREPRPSLRPPGAPYQPFHMFNAFPRG